MSCLCRTLFIPVSALSPSACRSGAGSAPHDAVFLILVSRMQSEVCGGAQPGADLSRWGGRNRIRCSVAEGIDRPAGRD